MMDWWTIIQEFAKWLFPIDIIISNPNIPIYIFLICVGIGFLIINYKYIIDGYNQLYENLSNFSKIFLSIAVGFIITLTSIILLLVVNSFSIIFFNSNFLNNSDIGIIFLVLSLFLGFLYFIKLKIPSSRNPFYIIKKLYFILMGLMFTSFVFFGIVVLLKSIYFIDNRNGIYLYIIYILKGLAIPYLVYILLKTILLISENYYKEYRKKFLCHDFVDSIIREIEKIYSVVEYFIISKLKGLF